MAAYLWIGRKHQATVSRIETACEQISVNEKDIIKLRADFNSLPTQSQFIELGKELRSLTSELSETKGRLIGINRAVDLINEFLINQGKGK